MQFEQSRWMIIVALLLFVVHYVCQMRFGWRQRGDDVGVLFNLLFYSPSAMILAASMTGLAEESLPKIHPTSFSRRYSSEISAC